MLKKLDGKQVILSIYFVFFLALSYGISAWKDIITTRPLFETTQGVSGEFLEKATLSGFQKELTVDEIIHEYSYSNVSSDAVREAIVLVG